MNKNQKGFSVVEVLVMVIIVVLISAVGWLVYDRQSSKADPAVTPTSTSSTQQNTAVEEQPKKVDETADWVKYSNKSGAFSVNYPKNWVIAKDTPTCTGAGLSITLMGTKDSVGDDCYGDQGQISLGSDSNAIGHSLPSESGLNNYKKESVTVAGVKGYKVSGTFKGTDTYIEQGAKMVSYSFITNDRTYFFQYRQNAKSPDLLSDFNTMVTQTFSFN